MAQITTSSGTFLYQPVHLFHGRRIIDKDVSFENLRSFNAVMGPAQLRFGIIYGTLLGAVRQGDFIDWDEDVDVYMHHEDRERFHDQLSTLREVGLELVRADGDLYSLMSKDNYIDVYFFRKNGSQRRCNTDVISSAYLTFEDKINFRGLSLFTPKHREKFLASVYGKDWRTPIRNKPAEPWSFWRRLRMRIKRRFPFLLVIREHIRRISK